MEEEKQLLILSANEQDIDNERNSKYVKQLNQVCERKECKNIAVMGPYGSGKSTVLLDFKKNKLEQCASISMIEFNESQQVDENYIEKVEESIVQQLIYQSKNEQIPFSNYRKEYPQKNNVSKNIIFSLFYFSLISLFLIFKLFNNIIDFEVKSFCSYVAVASFVAIFGFGIYWLYNVVLYIYKKFKLSKIKLTGKNTQIELNYNSIYNKYIDELFYYFKSTQKRFIIFEDIDRYNDKILFSHLRELNNLLNNSQYFEEKPIVFIYAIKDDLFHSQDRTKFFDFILPIIPVIDFSNSYHKFLEFISFDNKNEEIIKNISYYVSDYRLVKNICNEFNTYKSIQEGNIISDTNLFGLLVLKNLYPEEFSRMQYDKGIVKYLIESKRKFADNKIVECKDRLNVLDKVLRQDLYSINPTYTALGIMYDIIKKNKDIYTNGYTYGITGVQGSISSVNQLFDKKIAWNELIGENVSTLYFNCTTSTSRSFSEDVNADLKEKFKKLYKMHELLEANKNSSKKEKYDELKSLNDDVVYYSNIKISNLYKLDEVLFDEVYTEYTKELTCEKTENKKENYINSKFKSFIKLLVFNDVLNENYKTFISLTYGKNNLQDIDFIRNVVANIQNDFNQEIVDADYIYNQLQEDICKKESFNINIIKYLANKDFGLLNKLIMNSKDKISNLYEEISEGDECFVSVAKTVLHNDNTYLLSVDKSDLHKFNAWLKILMFIDNNDFDTKNLDNLKTYIEKYDFISIGDISEEDVNNLVKNMSGIKYKDIFGCSENAILYNAILKNNMYKINYDNLSVIDSNLNYSNLTTSSFVKTYLDANLESFVQILIDNNVETVQPEGFITLAINNVDKDIMCEYIRKNKVLLSDTTVVDNEELALAFTSNKVNILKLLSSSRLDANIKISILVECTKINQFIDENAIEISNVIINEKLFHSLLFTNKIYHSLLKQDISADNKVKLLDLSLDLSDMSNLMPLLKAYDNIFNKQRFELTRSPINLKIIEKLKTHNLFRVVDDGVTLNLEKVSMRQKNIQ